MREDLQALRRLVKVREAIASLAKEREALIASLQALLEDGAEAPSYRVGYRIQEAWNLLDAAEELRGQLLQLNVGGEVPPADEFVARGEIPGLFAQVWEAQVSQTEAELDDLLR